MDKVITSASNDTVKQLRRLLASGKERRKANRYVAEGIHLTESYLAGGQVPDMYICSVSSQYNHEVAELLEELRATEAKQLVLADSLFESLSTIHANVGIIIVFQPIKPQEISIATLQENTVLLEEVQDTGNLGTILRTAAAVGIRNIVLSPGCASPWSPKALRAGMGAQFSLNLHEDADLMKVLTEYDTVSIAATLGVGSVSLYDIDLRRPTCWLFGSEGRGVSETLASAATMKVAIPQEASSVESLNVATAASVCLYEQYRQNVSG